MGNFADALNNSLLDESGAVFSSLSKKGREMFFPKSGILGQSADAKSKKINATIGVANEDDGTPMALFGASKNISINKNRAFTYASSYGDLALREKWKEMILKKNPSISSLISLPVVSSAVTHGIFVSAFLFLDKDDKVIIPDYMWDNYRLIFENFFGSKIVSFPTFIKNSSGEDEFNISALREKINSSRKPVVLLNFPNNPTGYTPSENEVRKLKDMLTDCAKQKPVLVICDDAYFGLVYKEEIYTESVFSVLCGASENLLCIKLDGATKEDYAWGFRVGFITFAVKGGTQKLYSALEDKAAGTVRASISNVPHLSQSLLYDCFSDCDYESEKKRKYCILKERFIEVERVISLNEKYKRHFTALPHNSGYFMCIKLSSVDAEKLRRLLLEKFDTGVIAFNSIIRIAFSGVPKSKIPELFENIYLACEELENNNNY